MLCPKCKSDEPRLSHRRGVVEHLVSLFALYPYRCQDCNHRFFRFNYELRRGRPAGHTSQNRVEFVLYASAFALLLAFLYFVVTKA